MSLLTSALLRIRRERKTRDTGSSWPSKVGVESPEDEEAERNGHIDDAGNTPGASRLTERGVGTSQGGQDRGSGDVPVSDRLVEGAKETLSP